MDLKNLVQNHRNKKSKNDFLSSLKSSNQISHTLFQGVPLLQDAEWEMLGNKMSKSDLKDLFVKSKNSVRFHHKYKLFEDYEPASASFYWNIRDKLYDEESEGSKLKPENSGVSKTAPNQSNRGRNAYPKNSGVSKTAPKLSDDDDDIMFFENVMMADMKQQDAFDPNEDYDYDYEVD